ncbi:hypothetical protein [Pelosinus baikalensis]|uniref:Uncharacterized protein n=1 Tax=Pelosinus baikalensis TaxID=2892015 RepID=A0ABS8HS52_9FIRM|nr:hypothetical protein [Pelosinus baikalensis]MCC5465389.1 hypothetical protein [Pelosinus baikalensis]
MIVFVLLMTLYIIIPIILMGYISGVFLLKSGPMKFSDLRRLLGLFFGITILWLYVEQVVSGSLRLLTKNFFSLSGHFMVSEATLSFCLFIILIVFQILINPWKLSICFPNFLEHSIAGNVCNAQNEEGEYYFYVGKIITTNPCDSEYPKPSGIQY